MSGMLDGKIPLFCGLLPPYVFLAILLHAPYAFSRPLLEYKKINLLVANSMLTLIPSLILTHFYYLYIDNKLNIKS